VECRGAKYRVHVADCSMYCAGFRVQDSCRVRDAGAGDEVQGMKWRVRSAGTEVEGAECRG
jgi:hypothetical protein